MSSYDLLIKPLSNPSSVDIDDPPAAPHQDRPTVVEPPPVKTAHPPALSNADRALRRLLIADIALSIGGAVLGGWALPDSPLEHSLFIGAIAANVALWTAVAIAGTGLLLVQPLRRVVADLDAQEQKEGEEDDETWGPDRREEAA